jgi:Secretion system C-terminal sorting domain
MAKAVNACGSNTITTSGYGRCNSFSNSSFVVYPNPSSAEINIEYAEPEHTETDETTIVAHTPTAEFEVELFNDQGKTVLKAKSKDGNVRADVSAWRKGIYNLHIISKGERETRSVVID